MHSFAFLHFCRGITDGGGIFGTPAGTVFLLAEVSRACFSFFFSLLLSWKWVARILDAFKGKVIKNASFTYDSYE